MSSEEKIRVVLGKLGLDGHDRGAKVVARALRDSGFEVIYTGLHQSPENIIEIAIQEDVHAIGISILSGAHNYLIGKLLKLLKENEMQDISVFVGGIIPDNDAEELKKLGVKGVFGPGSSLDEISTFVKNNVRMKE